MKKIILSLIIAFTAIYSIVQAQNKTASLNQITSIGSWQNINDSTKKSIAVNYRLYPTQNMWTFIKLNTRNGQLWQVQYDTKGKNRFQTKINDEPLVTKELETNDRFTLYPTQNMFTFIMLDQFDGKMWQVQWSLNFEDRFIIPFP